jgi:hypothetical protein
MKPKKQSALWDTFRLHQQRSIDLHGSVLGNALNNVWWNGYMTALFEFGVLPEKVKDECIEWCPT